VDLRAAVVRRNARRALARRDQAGVTLVEVLIAMAVMVPLTLSSAMGLMTAMRSSDQAEQQQELNVALTNATESIRNLPYVPCASTEDLQRLYRDSGGPSAAEPMRVGAQLSPPSIDAVAYWDPDSRSYVDRCDVDGGAQRVTVTVISRRLGTATGSIVTTDSTTVLELRR
jgi:prepilin-type N-terminal cleavage/methylation domain-containing protein